MTARHWLLLAGAVVLYLAILLDAARAQNVLPCRPWYNVEAAPEGVHAYTDGAAIAFLAAYLKAIDARVDGALRPTAVYALIDGNRVLVVIVIEGRACWWPETTRQVYDRARRLAMGTGA